MVTVSPEPREQLPFVIIVEDWQTIEIYKKRQTIAIFMKCKLYCRICPSKDFFACSVIAKYASVELIAFTTLSESQVWI